MHADRPGARAAPLMPGRPGSTPGRAFALGAVSPSVTVSPAALPLIARVSSAANGPLTRFSSPVTTRLTAPVSGKPGTVQSAESLALEQALKLFGGRDGAFRASVKAPLRAGDREAGTPEMSRGSGYRAHSMTIQAAVEGMRGSGTGPRGQPSSTQPNRRVRSPTRSRPSAWALEGTGTGTDTTRRPSLHRDTASRDTAPRLAASGDQAPSNSVSARLSMTVTTLGVTPRQLHARQDTASRSGRATAG